MIRGKKGGVIGYILMLIAVAFIFWPFVFAPLFSVAAVSYDEQVQTTGLVAFVYHNLNLILMVAVLLALVGSALYGGQS